MICQQTIAAPDQFFEWPPDPSTDRMGPASQDQFLDAPSNDPDAATQSRWYYNDNNSRRLRLLAVIEADDGEYSAYSPSLLGAAGQGDTPDAAVCDLMDSIKALLASYAQDGKQAPIDSDPAVPEQSATVFTRWIEVHG